MDIVSREDAPQSSLPTWEDCAMRVDNSKFVNERKSGGGHCAEPDSKLASALHHFIYEYDDADPYRSAWFRHRLECVLQECVAEQAAEIARLRARQRELREELAALRPRSPWADADLDLLP